MRRQRPAPTRGRSTTAQYTDFMATRDGLALAKAFMRIGDVQLRRRILYLVEEIEENQS